MLLSLLDKTEKKLYQKNLFANFYKKGGKSIAITYIIKSIIRFSKLDKKKQVVIADIGCGDGSLLAIIENVLIELGLRNRFLLIGLDYDNEMLTMAKRKIKQGAEFYNIDLTDENLHKDLNTLPKIDIMICINTFHEVFSAFILNNHEKQNDDEKIELARKQCTKVMHNLIGPFSKNLDFIFYDGLDIDTQSSQDSISFNLLNISEQNFKRFIDEYSLFKLMYKKVNGKIWMRKDHFLKFISTFKYFDKALWNLEKYQSYFYFDRKQFEKIIYSSNLVINTILTISNDLNLWKQYVTLTSNIGFPSKAILLVASSEKGQK